ncbi:MAG: O-antigen ligase family protein [Candidatus Eisenbacteria bacterium]
MQGRSRIEQVGRVLFISGLSIFAVSGSFSISLTEGGVLLAWVGFVLRWRAPGRGRNMILLDYLVAALLVWVFITALTSPHRLTSLKAFRSEWLVLTYFLISFGIESSGQLRRIFRLLAIVASVLAIYGIIQHFTGVDYIKHKHVHAWRHTYKALGLLGHHITFGIFYAWVFSISLSFLVFISGNLRSKITWTVLTCLPALAVLYSFSRAAWLGATFSLLAIAALKRFRVGYLVLVVLAVVVVAVILEPSAIERATVPTGGEQASRSDATRVLLLKTSFRMIRARPVFGIGPGTFTAEFDDFKVPGDYSTTCHPHNDFVNYAVTSGLIGLAIMVAIVITALRAALEVYGGARDSVTRTLAAAACGGIVVIVVSGFFQCNLTDSEIAVQAWLIVGTLGLLVRMRRSEGSTQHRDDSARTQGH